jgi:hypothetical protein
MIKELIIWNLGGIIWLASDNLALKTMGLENLEFEFPRREKRGFFERASQEWDNLIKRNTIGASTSVARLKVKLNPPRGKLSNFTVFTLWIILCLQRPWENPELSRLKINDLIRDGKRSSGRVDRKRYWHIMLSEVRDNSIWDQVDEIISRVLKDYPDYPGLRTLKSHINRPNFIWSVISLAFNPIIIEEIVKSFSRVERLFRIPPSLVKRARKSDFIQAARLLDYVQNHKYARKRDLMRKFSINKARCDFLLDYILEVDAGYLKIRDKLPDNSVLIVYSGPEHF